MQEELKEDCLRKHNSTSTKPKEIEAEPHPEKMWHNNKEYYFSKVLGKGGQGIVYLY